MAPDRPRHSDREPRSPVSRFVEPTSRLPLRWGTWRTRSAWGLTLIASGIVNLQGANSHFQLPLLTGVLADVLGWWILPAPGWRRVLVSAACALQIYLLLAGPQAMLTFLIPFAGWLVVRQRPVLSWMALIPVALNGTVALSAFGEYSGELPALGITAVVLVASGWCAYFLAVIRRNPSAPHLPSNASDPA